LTNKQLSSVKCPTCGVDVGEPYLWNSGGLRLGPHVNRKLSAIEFIAGDKSNERTDPRSSPAAAGPSAPAPARVMPLR